MKKLLLFLAMLAAFLVAAPELKAQEVFGKGDTLTVITATNSTQAVTTATSVRVTGYKLSCTAACAVALRNGLSNGTVKLRPTLGAAGALYVPLSQTSCAGKVGVCFPKGIYAEHVTGTGTSLEIFYQKN